MFGHWLLGLRDEYMRKSKKELVSEIMNLKLRLQTKENAESTKKFVDSFEVLSLRSSLHRMSEQCELLQSQVTEWKQKYADEVQKRLQLLDREDG